MSKTVVFANANSKIQRVQIGEKVGGEGSSRGDVVKSKHGGYRLGTGEVTIAEDVGENSRMGRRKSTSKTDKESSRTNGGSRRSTSRGKQGEGPGPGPGSSRHQPGGDNDKDNRLQVAQKSDINAKKAEVCRDQSKPKPTIQEFYQEKGGISYGHVRRMNKMGIQGTGISRTNQVLAVVDFYTPPPGYGKSDLPDIKDVLSQSSEEQPMSPAVTICKTSKRAVRPPSKSSEADHKTFLSKLEQRNCKTAKKVEPGSPLNQSTRVDPTAMSESFPDDSLNYDEELILASQQVENAEEDLKNQLVSQVRKRDFNGNCKNTFTCDPDGLNSNSPPLTSTPVATTSGNTNKKVGPKIIRETPNRPSLSRGRRLSKREATFETSTENLDPSRKDENNDDEAEAPKLGKALKYDLGSPIKPVTNHDISGCGEFPDDDDEFDNIISQLEIPDESKKDDINQQITTKAKGGGGFLESSTSTNTGEDEDDGEDEEDGEEMGSVLSESQLNAFMQLEEETREPSVEPTTVTCKATLSTPYKAPRPVSSHNDSSEDSPKEPSSTQRRRMGSTRRILRHTPTKMT